MNASLAKRGRVLNALLILVICFSLTRSVRAQQILSPATAPTQNVVIPFRYDSLTCPIPIIQARLNGSKSLSFLLDTGMPNPPLLTNETAKLLKLRRSMTMLDRKTGKPDGYIATIKQIEVACDGGNQWTPFDMDHVYVADWYDALMPVYANPPLAGVIGISFLKDKVARFDFVAHILTLLPADAKVEMASDAITLPLSQISAEDMTPLVDLPLPDRTRLAMQIDTGAEGVLLPEAG